MNHPIMFTVSDILWLAGAIVAISAAVKVIAECISRMQKPNKTQDERIGKLEKKAVADYERNGGERYPYIPQSACTGTCRFV